MYQVVWQRHNSHHYTQNRLVQEHAPAIENEEVIISIVIEYAKAGNAVIVGRGSQMILRD